MAYEAEREFRDADNWQAWAVGRVTKYGFQARRVVWGRKLARAEKRPEEKIIRAALMVEYHGEKMAVTS